MGRASAWAPPASARLKRNAPTERGSASPASRFLCFSASRWPYSSQRNSSIGLTETWLSEPMPKAPPAAR